jgi:class 3 adenylate cyclase
VLVGEAPQTRYATTAGGVHIAYQSAGHGSVDLLVCPNAFFAADQLRAEPGWRAFLKRLASFSRVILYDCRGTGLSDPITPEDPPSLEQWADDALVVMDALGSEGTAVLGVEEGWFVATVLAATHPERVSALVLVHPVPGRSQAGADGLFGQTTPVFEQTLDAVWNGEITDEAIAAFAPSKQGDAEFREWTVGALRHSASPATARALFDVNFWSNVDAVLPTISVPTLVLHRVGNRFVPIGYGRHVAQSIPDAVFVEVPGEDHIVNGAEQQPILDGIEEFLTGTRREPDPDRLLATVLFTDIVESTQQAASLGDRRWRELLERHDATATKLIADHRGRLIKTTGDGVLATFDGPGRAIRCALAMRSDMSAFGIRIRAGVHTGEIELCKGDIGGIAVHIGQRVSTLAGTGEVLVSRTVPDLVAGSGFAFRDKGEHDLKGVPGTWQLFAVDD